MPIELLEKWGKYLAGQVLGVLGELPAVEPAVDPERAQRLVDDGIAAEVSPPQEPPGGLPEQDGQPPAKSPKTSKKRKGKKP